MNTAGLKTQDDRWVARRVVMAHSFRQRLLGLLRHKALDAEEGLLITPGASIHTFGMRFSIDAVFLNGQMKILRLASHIPPWRVRLAPARTRYVLELPAGRIQALRLESDTYICMEAPSVLARSTLASSAHPDAREAVPRRHGTPLERPGMSDRTHTRELPQAGSR